MQSSATAKWLALRNTLGHDDGAVPPPELNDLKAAVSELKSQLPEKKRKKRQKMFYTKRAELGFSVKSPAQTQKEMVSE